MTKKSVGESKAEYSRTRKKNRIKGRQDSTIDQRANEMEKQVR